MRSSVVQLGSSTYVSFNRWFLCEGESIKVVIDARRGFTQEQVLLKLFIFGDDGSKIERQSDAISLIQISDTRYIGEVKTGRNGIPNGFYEVRVFVLSNSQGTTPNQSFDVTNQSFAASWYEVFAFSDYSSQLNQLFGEDWDDPVFLDSSNADELNEIFRSWNIEVLPQEKVNSMIYGLYSKSVVERIVQFIFDSLLFQTALPFTAVAQTDGITDLPHIDLTKYFWVVSVLGPAWTDLLFYTNEVELVLHATTESMSIALKPSILAYEGRSLVPSEEPKIFQILRERLVGTLNFELKYDPHVGIQLLVNRVRSSLSMSAG